MGSSAGPVCVLVVVFLMALGPTYAIQSPADLLLSDGYPCEVHHVTTLDGYILELDRIPRPGARVVYVANALSGSAASYLRGGKGKALGFLLYDAGFDVWLGNFRGNPFSLGHVHLSSSSDDFWKFGWHENGALDNPAMMEYALAHTGQPDLIYAGHSMGGTTFFVTASERPDLAAKVRAAFLFAPAVFLTHTKNDNLLAVRLIVNASHDVAARFHEHRESTRLFEKVADELCGDETPRSYRYFCSLAGPGPHHFGPGSPFNLMINASTEQLLHYAQLTNIKWPGFRKYNFGGEEENRLQYGVPFPPDYKLSRIRTPVYLYNGRGDTTCTPEDQLELRARLQNVRRFFFSPNSSFNHFSFCISPSAVEDMWKFVLADMKPFAKQDSNPKSSQPQKSRSFGQILGGILSFL